MRELAELEASVEFGRHLQSSLFFPGPSRQNNQILDLYAGVSCQGAELTPSDQTTTRNEDLCCSHCLLCAAEKYAATHTHTHECALCESVYTSCNRFIAHRGSAECETAFCEVAVLYFYGVCFTHAFKLLDLML